MADQDKSMLSTFEAVFGNRLSMTDAPSSQFVTGGRILEVVSDLIKTYGCEYKDQIKEAAGNAFEAWIRPIDLPVVPNFIEKKVDDQLKKSLLNLIDSLFEECKKAEKSKDKDSKITVNAE